jgi:hypothetical protein
MFEKQLSPCSSRAARILHSLFLDSLLACHLAQVLVQQPQPQEQQQHGGLPDDDSLVLYKDPSGLSMQQSVASVASGAQHIDPCII